MSGLAELFDIATKHGLVLGLHDGKLVVRSATGAAVPAGLRGVLRANRGAIVAHLIYREQAVEVIQAAMRRLYVRCPAGCDLDTAEGRRLDEGITAAYWSGDLGEVGAAVAAYEKYALERFASPSPHGQGQLPTDDGGVP